MDSRVLDGVVAVVLEFGGYGADLQPQATDAREQRIAVEGKMSGHHVRRVAGRMTSP